MNREMIIVAIVAVVSGLLGGAIAAKFIIEPEPEYEFGTALLVGSDAYPAAHRHATFEAKIKQNERVFKLQLEDVPELARTTLKVSIDDTVVGDLKVDGKGNGVLAIRARGNEPFPTVVEGSMVKVKTSDGILVASGSF